ncbi:Uncharacterized protein FWK35_00003205 [Aphis craccivora]|uniref:Uncharacterized protein n=1 Tax=Aphis craccivora TaxID=307492 RepID=A0A6G0Z4U9_APHCR|nr:Uncharacterized protein FWK35_00003205 [Aphis craccivora]
MNVLILQCCVFFFCICVNENVEIMLQFQTLGVVSDSKMNLVGALGRSFFELPNSFQKRREILRKNGNFYAKPVFDQNCNSKTNHCKYMKKFMSVLSIYS